MVVTGGSTAPDGDGPSRTANDDSGDMPADEFPVDPATPASEEGDVGAGAHGRVAPRTLSGLPVGRLRTLAEEYGTPLCVRDLRRVAENYDRMASGSPSVRFRVPAGGLGVCDVETLATLRRAGAGVVCASPDEVRTAMDAGLAPARVHYDLSGEHLDWVLEHCRGEPATTVVVGDRDTLERLVERGFRGRTAIRVAPEGSGARAELPQAIPVGELSDVLAAIRESLRVVGVTVVGGAGAGQQGDEAAALASAVDRVLDVVGGGLEFVSVDAHAVELADITAGDPPEKRGTADDPDDSDPAPVRAVVDAGATAVVRPGPELLDGARLRLTGGPRSATSGGPADGDGVVRVTRVEDGPVDRTVLVDEDGRAVDPLDSRRDRWSAPQDDPAGGGRHPEPN